MDQRVDYFCRLPWPGRAHRLGAPVARPGTMACQDPVAVWPITGALRLRVRPVGALGVVVVEG